MLQHKLQQLLQRFLVSKDSTEIESFLAENSDSLNDLDQTQTFLTNRNYADTNPSFESLHSMHFAGPYTTQNKPSQSQSDIHSVDTDNEHGTTKRTVHPLNERYRHVGKLGEGGMATVWKIEDTELFPFGCFKKAAGQEILWARAGKFHCRGSDYGNNYNILELYPSTILKSMMMAMSTLRCVRFKAKRLKPSFNLYIRFQQKVGMQPLVDGVCDD